MNRNILSHNLSVKICGNGKNIVQLATKNYLNATNPLHIHICTHTYLHSYGGHLEGTKKA